MPRRESRLRSRLPLPTPTRSIARAGNITSTWASLTAEEATMIRIQPGQDNHLGWRDDRSFDIHDAKGKIGHLTGYLGGPWSDVDKDTEFRVTHVEISEPG